MRNAIIAYVLTTGAALAHEGHPEAQSQGAAHWLAQPDHLVGLLAVIGLGIMLRKGLRASARARG